MNKISPFLRNYELMTLSTDTARANEPFKISGNTILIFSSPVNVSIRLHNVNNASLPLKQYDSIVERGEDGFQSFYITHSVLVGGTITLAVYTNQNLFLSIGAGSGSGGGAATTIGENGLNMPLVDTEYSIALTANTKRVKLINHGIDAIYYVSFESGNSANGIPIKPLSTHNIENIDLVGYVMYIQSDLANRTIRFMEFL